MTIESNPILIAVIAGILSGIVIRSGQEINKFILEIDEVKFINSRLINLLFEIIIIILTILLILLIYSLTILFF